MPFPDSPRVLYRKNPLTEVICQLRFPAILRIDSEVPAKYQEHLREAYPIFEEQPTQNFKLNLQPDIGKLIGGPLSLRGKSSYGFISADGNWKVNLTRDFIALSTVEYRRWEDFREHLRLPLELLIEEYSPPFFIRIGLRYQDVIQRSKLGLEGVEWADLLKAHTAGELSSPDIANDILQSANQLTVKLDEGRSQVLINHGLANNQEGEICYLIDSDFSTEQRTEVDDAARVLDNFNAQSGRLFRWCITERLHAAMEPEEIPSGLSD
jgi:uncharacterized protein (TIGR04255 family)